MCFMQPYLALLALKDESVNGPLTHPLPLVEVQVDRPNKLYPSDLGDKLQGDINHLIPARLDAQPIGTQSPRCCSG